MAENEAIGTIASELVSIATEHGYEGPQDLTIAGAIDALADTLAGEDVDSGRTIAEAVRALAPYVGGGGSEINESPRPFFAPRPNSMILSTQEQPEDSSQTTVGIILMAPSGSTVPGVGGDQNNDTFMVAQHLWVQLGYSGTYNNVTVKSMAGEDWPHDVWTVKGVTKVNFMVPTFAEMSNPLKVTIA